MRRREFTPNDTRGVIRLLSRRYAGTARGRNRILLATVILCIVVLTMVFGITRGKIRAEELNAIRTAGTAASGIVEDGNVSQYAALKAAGYIRQAGRCVTVGPAETGETVCSIRWADADAWEKLLRPAYTEVHGNYPEQEQEIMLSGRALKTLGITDPEEGMEISLRVFYSLFQSSDETFRLSGWFTDHGGEAVPGYVSEKKLSDWGIRPDEEADLIFRQADRLDWQETEARLYDALQMNDPGQKITVSDTAAYQAVSGMTGGYGMAALGTVIVLCGIFFLCHNVLQISMAGDIRQLGLLNTIGATQKQLSKVYYSQIRRILIPGSVAGAALSAVLLIGIIPAVLSGEYLEKTGGAEGLHIFHPGILLLSILFADGIVLAASAGVIRRTVGMSCRESVGYTDASVRNSSRKRRGKDPVFIKKKRSPAGEMRYLAGRNIAGHRKRFILTVLSLFLGLETFLWAVVITSGSDYSHVIEQRPDFLIAGQFSAYAREEGYGEEYKTRDAGQDPMLTEGNSIQLLYDNDYDEFSPISADVRDELMDLDGVKPEESYIMEGAYLYAVISQKGIRPLEKNFSYEDAVDTDDNEMIEGWEPDVVQILNEEEIGSLKKYVDEKKLAIDMDSLENGTGVLILHDHALSPAQEKQAQESVGEPVYFKTMLSREERIRWNRTDDAERTEQEETGDFSMKQSEEFTLCGYLDNRADGFPDIRQTWHGAEGSLYFLISEKGFSNIPTEKKTLYMELTVDEDKEPAVNAAVQRIISEDNQARSRMTETSFDEEENGEAGIFCISKSDLMSEASSYIRGSRMILGSISAVLLLAGFTNYFNIMVTGFLARKRELDIMESIGMTQRQKRKLIADEGAYYCLFTAGLLLTAGMAAFLPVRYYMEQKLSYFVFNWPVTEMLLLIGGLVVINGVTAWKMCKVERAAGVSCT
ncbi:MAG TPA: ABC transporter permease [Candidatus Mediterraneibacter quadrami]|uniref:ABC transporter permease n=1 Tax=Candidatus Mediterraneibacter quadrami TaxID=2838684 RepID=A0A9D2RF90_9FIRM|nr:ABC transporter permease [Candidatus Mediterraneibacter quadrami]